VPRPFWPSSEPTNRRLDPDLYRISGQPCSFTIRAYGRLRPFAEPRFAAIAQQCLLESRARYGCEVDAYCIMPDHVHLVATPFTDRASSLTFVDRFKGLTSFRLGRAGSGNSKVWQPRYHDHLIGPDDVLERIIEYILDNPVRQSLCLQPEDYPWSGIPPPARAAK